MFLLINLNLISTIKHDTKRIKKDNKVPIIPEKQPKIKYNIPIFLWFTLKIHFFIFFIKFKFNIYTFLEIKGIEPLFTTPKIVVMPLDHIQNKKK